MRTLYPLIALMLLATAAAAQNPSPPERQLTPSYYEGTLFAKLNLTSLIDPITPTIQPGLEYRFNKRLSGELTIGLPVRLWPGTYKTDSTYNRYYKVKAELRFFPGNQFFYVGPQLFLTKRKYSKYDGELREDGDDYFYDYAKLDKTIIGFICKTGKVFPITDVFNLEMFAGFGARFVQLDLEAQGLAAGSRAGWMFRIPDRRGWSTGAHLEVGLKFSRTIY